MKFVTWIEAILVVTLVTLAVAAAGIARKVVEADDAPEEATYLRQANVDRAEHDLARAKDESTRVHAKHVDASAEIVKREADLAAGVGDAKALLAARNAEKGLAALLRHADTRLRTAETELSRRKKVAGGAYKNAKDVFEYNARVDALRAAAVAVLLVFGIAWAALHYSKTLDARRPFVFGTLGAIVAVAAVYEFFQEPGVIAVAALAVLALVVAIARATSQEETRG